jgi:hypothetical protein
MECAAMQTWFEEEYKATSFAEQYTSGGHRHVLLINTDIYGLPDC